MTGRLRTAGEVAHGLVRLVGGLVQVRRTGARGIRAVAVAVRRYRLGYAALGLVAARRDPDGTALVDDDGALTYAQLDRRAAGLAAAIAARGSRPPARIGVLCRNGRGFVTALLAAARTGADLVLLDPGLGVPALRELLHRERVDLVLADGDDLRSTIAALGAADPPVLDVSRHQAATAGAPTRGRPGRLVVLTSGTTGAPRGADRGDVRPGQAVPVTTLVSRIPVGPGTPMLLLPPLFHGYGVGFLALALAFGMPVLLSRRFDPARAVRLLAEHPDAMLVAVPPMLARIVRELDGRPAPAVRAAVSGAGPLHPAVSTAVLDAFGPVLFNLYGSTEEGWSTLAGPADLRAAPGTIGRPAAGVRVEVLDDAGRPVPPGATGHLCVGSRLAFSHYTGGGDRRRRGGLTDTGDLGHRDASGLLHVDGRADDVVVTGGEKVLATEIAAVLAGHPGIADARVDGVPDEAYGARLEAVLVAEPGVDTDGLPAELARYVADRLARHKVPRVFRFVDELPVTATGKHRRRVT